MLSHRENVWTSKFWRKWKEKKQIFFRKSTKGMSGYDLGQKKFKIISCLCTFNCTQVEMGLRSRAPPNLLAIINPWQIKK